MLIGQFARTGGLPWWSDSRQRRLLDEAVATAQRSAPTALARVPGFERVAADDFEELAADGIAHAHVRVRGHRRLVRIPRFRLVYAMSCFFGLFVFMPGLRRGLSRSGFFAENALTMMALYGLLMLGHVAVNLMLRTYRAIWRYVGLGDAIVLARNFALFHAP